MHIKKGILDRIEGAYAVIELEDGQKLLWETANLPPNFTEGEAIVLEVKNHEMAEQDNRELAENILHEIFNNTGT